jgi:hypothetical protein
MPGTVGSRGSKLGAYSCCGSGPLKSRIKQVMQRRRERLFDREEPERQGLHQLSEASATDTILSLPHFPRRTLIGAVRHAVESHVSAIILRAGKRSWSKCATTMPGYRALAFNAAKVVRLVSRNRIDFSNDPQLLEGLKSLEAKNFIVDVAACAPGGSPDERRWPVAVEQCA